VRRGAGRKPKPADEKQGSRIMVNLTKPERRELEQAAQREPLGGYVRRLILRHLARRNRKR